MSKNTGDRAVRTKSTPVALYRQVSTPEELPGANRLTTAHVLPLIGFPLIGALLHLVGSMPITDVFLFLGGCGTIGASVTIAVTGGRRAMVAIAHGVLAASDNR
ncbi:hypothetical protein ABT169_20860 [Streptomyces sp. NPDC001616]|uniref:hypothetical protein n=1 Tax=Streptomyces sp. NPDC001616 TaxID=3156648 RepID=UPI00332D5DC0